MPFIEALAQQAGGQIVGNAVNEGMGLLFQGIKNKQQLKQAGKMQDLQIKGSKQLTDYNTAKQLQMWKDTSYGAQKEQMEKAGLNPALMYGMSGGGGQTANIAQGSVGQQSAGTAQASRGAEGMGLQSAMLKAQIDNLNADTKDKLANIPVKGAQVGQIGAQTASLTQGIENQKAQKLLIDAQTSLTNSNDSKVKREEQELWMTQNDRVTVWAEEAKRKIQEVKQAVIQTGVDEKTADEKVKILEGEAAGVIIQNELNKARIKLTDEQAKAIGVELLQKWVSLSQEERKTAITERVGKFNSAQSQRTYDNILKGINTVVGAVKPGTVINQGPRETTVINN